ncbi:MFS transporter [Larkinella soli]|uniref:MFS transporter n=1 Tax=Larkinella soli TaxID=1770527 RepID=UPI000FFB3718|nr:MFS transporter [Larkinella soli]
MIGRSLRLYRDAYRGLSPSIWLLAAVMLINRSGTMVLPYLSLYLTQRLHYSVTDAGIVMAVYGFGALAGTFLGGRLTDRIGFYPVQLFTLLISGGFLIALQFVQGFQAMCTVVFCYTLLGEGFRPAVSSAVAHYSTPATRTRAYSLNRLAINLGWSVGGGLGGYLAAIDYGLLFWVDGLTCILAAGVLRLYLRPPERSQPAETPTGPEPAAVGSPYRDRVYLVFTVCTILFAVSFMQFFSMIPLYFKEVMNLTVAQIGMLMTLNGLMIAFVEMALVYGIEKRFAHRKSAVIAVGVLLVGLSFLLLNVGPWPSLAVVWTLVNTVGEMLSMPFMQSFTVERARDHNRGQYLALHGMAYAIAQIAAPAVGSQVVQSSGYPALWYGATVLCTISAGLLWWLAGRVKVETGFNKIATPS